LEKVEMKTKYWITSGIGALVFAVSQAASARVDVGLNIGIPAPVYVAPAPVVAYQAAPMVVIGWHANRYWDGRRWWGRDEWNSHHHYHNDHRYHDDHHHDHD
jgi:hypothetical protein